MFCFSVVFLLNKKIYSLNNEQISALNSNSTKDIHSLSSPLFFLSFFFICKFSFFIFSALDVVAERRVAAEDLKAGGVAECHGRIAVHKDRRDAGDVVPAEEPSRAGSAGNIVAGHALQRRNSRIPRRLDRQIFACKTKSKERKKEHCDDEWKGKCEIFLFFFGGGGGGFANRG